MKWRTPLTGPQRPAAPGSGDTGRHSREEIPLFHQNVGTTRLPDAQFAQQSTVLLYRLELGQDGL